MTLRRALTHPLLWTAVLFIALPFVAGANPFKGQWSGFVGIATTMVIFALFASGFNLLFGHVGELSFGHAMFFTIGAYSTALYSKGFTAQLFGADAAPRQRRQPVHRAGDLDPRSRCCGPGFSRGSWCRARAGSISR